MNSRNKPKFQKQNAHAKKRAQKTGWRKPRGIDSKQKKGKKSKGAHPKIGYGAPTVKKFLHPSGYSEVYVRNILDLENVDPDRQAIRIASAVGKKKREEIIKKADEMKIKILNR